MAKNDDGAIIRVLLVYKQGCEWLCLKPCKSVNESNFFIPLSKSLFQSINKEFYSFCIPEFSYGDSQTFQLVHISLSIQITLQDCSFNIHLIKPKSRAAVRAKRAQRVKRTPHGNQCPFFVHNPWLLNWLTRSGLPSTVLILLTHLLRMDILPLQLRRSNFGISSSSFELSRCLGFY